MYKRQPRERADGDRPQLPGQDQRQYRQQRGRVGRGGGSRQDGLVDPLGRGHGDGPVSYTHLINLRDLDRQLEIARATAKSRGESYDIFKLRFEGGIISVLELSQNKSQYEEALASIPPLEKAIAQQENGLSVLLGRNPGPIPRGKDIDHLTLPVIPAGLPSDLLERRPDLRRTEQNLIAANALIGDARAAYFPTISLTGLFGDASTGVGILFDGPNKVGS